jgi:hypothetical protein
MSKRKRKIQSHTDEEREYASCNYWEERYKSGHNVEWYFDFDCLQPLIEPCIESDGAAVLEIGCGDSPLIASLEERALGLFGIDFSKTIIDGLVKEQKKSSIAQYLYMDARKMIFGEEHFDFIIDKGTIDAMLCYSKKGFENVRKILLECVRVMKNTAKLMLVSNMEFESENFSDTMQNCIIPVLSHGENLNWRLDVHAVRNDDGTSHASVYIFSSTPRPLTRALAKSINRRRGQDTKIERALKFSLPIKISDYFD